MSLITCKILTTDTPSWILFALASIVGSRRELDRYKDEGRIVPLVLSINLIIWISFLEKKLNYAEGELNAFMTQTTLTQMNWNWKSYLRSMKDKKRDNFHSYEIIVHFMLRCVVTWRKCEIFLGMII